MTDTAQIPLKRTPLHPLHTRLGARFMPFAGWDMPVQYSSIVDEHTAVRTRAGLFDTTHMGTFRVSGDGAPRLFDRVMVGAAGGLLDGRARYSLMLNEAGGIIDDLIVYRTGADYIVIVNAGTKDSDYAWFSSLTGPGCTLQDISATICLSALQGPAAQGILELSVGQSLSDMRSFSIRSFTIKGCAEPVMIARTGYTGEDGFEMLLPAPYAESVWNGLIQAGAVPCGLGCRDTLRLEAGMPLYGHEITEATDPFQAGLGWTVRWDHDFIGRSALERRCGIKDRPMLTALTVSEGIPRAGGAVMRGDVQCGIVTSGSYSPTLRTGIALAYIGAPAPHIGDELSIIVHGRPRAARVVEQPFYRRAGRIPVARPASA